MLQFMLATNHAKKWVRDARIEGKFDFAEAVSRRVTAAVEPAMTALRPRLVGKKTCQPGHNFHRAMGVGLWLEELYKDRQFREMVPQVLFICLA